MKKFFKIFLMCLILVFSFSLAACGSNAEDGQNDIEDTSETYTSIKNVATRIGENLTSAQKSAVLPSEYQTDVYSIAEAGNYYFTGTLSSAISVATNSGDVHIYLNNATLSVDNSVSKKTAVAAITSEAGANLIVTLIGTNSLTTTGTYAAHAISSVENLVINGTGTLNINSSKSAISSDAGIVGLGGTINVTAAKHGLKADQIYIDGMTVNAVSCTKDLIHAESDYDEVETAPTFSFSKGFVCIISGNLNATDNTLYGDGIQADSFVYIKDGEFDITTTPTWTTTTATVNRENGMYNVSTHKKVARDDVRAGSTYAALSESVKAIKVGEIDYIFAGDTTETEYDFSSNKYTILVEGGTFDLNTVDDAIHTNSGSAFIYGGDFTINTSDDGIHADTNLKISGSSTKITIETSFEGIEAQTIDISNGEVTINADDDGINASACDDNISDQQAAKICQINISGGRVDVTVDPSKDTDGIDSNGGIKITGGVVISRGPNNPNASALDASNAIVINGGTVIVIGRAPGSSSNDFGGRGGSEGTFSTTLTKTTSSNGLTKSSHTVTVGSAKITYTNAYKYSGSTTVYASGNATVN